MPDASGFAYNGTLTNFALTGTISNWIAGSPVTTGNTCSVVIPVELMSFEGKYVPPFGGQGAGGNLLTWTTANEVNNKGFDVERSMGNGTWETLGFVAVSPPTPKGENRAYTFLDTHISTLAGTRVTPPLGVGGGTYYYRLRQIDNDGKETLSKVISIETKGKTTVKVYPSVTKGAITIEGAQSFEVVNTMGQVVLSEKAIHHPSFNIHHLASGLYLIRGVDTEGGIFSKKIIKQ